MQSEVREIPNSLQEINDYRSIKPEGDVTVKESRNFWDNLFDCKILKDSHFEANQEILSKEESDVNINKEKANIEEQKDDSNYDENFKEKVQIETGWSDEIINAIGSLEEYDIYINAGLVEDEIGGNKCLIRSDIDWKQKDALGRTNRERAEQGLSPINKDGKSIELHHIGQHADSPLAELTQEEHRGKGNDTILHNKTKESEIDRQAFARERSSHWEARVNEGSYER